VIDRHVPRRPENLDRPAISCFGRVVIRPVGPFNGARARLVLSPMEIVAQRRGEALATPKSRL